MKKILIQIISYILFFCILGGIYGSVHLNPEDDNSNEYPVFDEKQSAPSVAAGVDWWPMYGHDAANTRVSSSSGPATNQMFVNKQIVSDIVSSDIIPDVFPVVFDNTLYFQLNHAYGVGLNLPNQVFCVNAGSGSILWNKSLSYYSEIIGIAVDNDKIYLSHGGLVCLNAVDGSENWVYPIATASAPVVAYEKIYFASLDNNIYCINKDGTKAWNTFLDYGDPWSPVPVVANGKVYFVTVLSNGYITNVSLYCLDAATGNKIWVYTLQNYFLTASPTVADGKVFFTAIDSYETNKTIFCLDAVGNSNGTTNLLWSVSKIDLSPRGICFNGPYPLAVAGNRVYSTLNSHLNAGESYSVVFCLDATQNGNELWSYTLSDGNDYFSAPSVADGKVYVCGKNTVYCFDGAGYGNGTTELIWSYQRQGVFRDNERFFSPVIANGKVWVCWYNYLETRRIGYDIYDFYGFSFYGFGSNQPPEKPQTPNGPINGLVNEQYIYSTTPSSDPDGDAVEYQFDWDATGAHDYSEWSEAPSIGHTWNKAGTYTVRVRARDIYQAESAWSDSLQVAITGTSSEQLTLSITPSTIPEEEDFVATVTLKNTPIEGAIVEFAGSSKLTDAVGKTTFTAPSVDKDTAYTITAQYNDYRSVPITVMVLDKSAEFHSWIFGVVTDTAGQLLYGANVCISLSGEQTKECTFTDEQGRYYKAVRAGTYTVEAAKAGYQTGIQNITVRENNATAVDFNLEENVQPPDETQQLIDHAILDRKISGTITFRPQENQIHYESSVYLSDVAFTITGIEKTSISLLVNSENPAGSTIVFDINEGVFQSENLGLLINGEHIQKADSLEDVLNAADDTTPEWFMQEKQTDGGVWLFVSIPHFSEYHITIYQIVETVSKILLGTLYGAILVIGAGGAFYIVVFSGTLRFRKKRIKNENKKLEE